MCCEAPAPTSSELKAWRLWKTLQCTAVSAESQKRSLSWPSWAHKSGRVSHPPGKSIHHHVILHCFSRQMDPMELVPLEIWFLAIMQYLPPWAARTSYLQLVSSGSKKLQLILWKKLIQTIFCYPLINVTTNKLFNSFKDNERKARLD